MESQPKPAPAGNVMRVVVGYTTASVKTSAKARSILSAARGRSGLSTVRRLNCAYLRI